MPELASYFEDLDPLEGLIRVGNDENDGNMNSRNTEQLKKITIKMERMKMD